MKDNKSVGLGEIVDGIKGAGQIFVRTLVIRAEAKKINELSSKISSRSLSVDFTYSKGDATTQLTEYAQNLKKTGDAIALLMQHTAVALENTVKAFEIVDQTKY